MIGRTGHKLCFTRWRCAPIAAAIKGPLPDVAGKLSTGVLRARTVNVLFVLLVLLGGPISGPQTSASEHRNDVGFVPSVPTRFRAVDAQIELGVVATAASADSFDSAAGDEFRDRPFDRVVCRF